MSIIDPRILDLFSKRIDNCLNCIYRKPVKCLLRNQEGGTYYDHIDHMCLREWYENYQATRSLLSRIGAIMKVTELKNTSYKVDYSEDSLFDIIDNFFNRCLYCHARRIAIDEVLSFKIPEGSVGKSLVEIVSMALIEHYKKCDQYPAPKMDRNNKQYVQG